MGQTAPNTERIELTKSPDLPGVDILLVDNCSHRWRAFHETFTTCTGLAISQAAEWKYRGRSHYQTADGLMLMEPGEVHANTKITAPASFRVLMIDPSIVARAAEQLGTAPNRVHLKVAQLTGGSIYRAFVGLHASLEQHSTALERESRFATCVRLLLECCIESPTRPLETAGKSGSVQRAREYLHAHFSAPVSLNELVAIAGSASRFHLVHAFSAQLGLPPHAYQIQLRITHACRLLKAGWRPTDVAAELGFADQSHFNRHFKRTLGVTPAAFAQTVAI